MSPLEFYRDAIVLSGIFGTKLKTSIISQYYKFWLDVTTKGSWGDVTIVEMDAGTGELHIKETNETILGSAGHALELKYGSNYTKLEIILIEQSKKCRIHMDNVMKHRWPDAVLRKARGGRQRSIDGEITRFGDVDSFLNYTSNGESFGISLFYFDPLLAVPWKLINRIAKARITTPYEIGTEFLIFFFTSDWIEGRKGFHPLPRNNDRTTWTKEERQSAKLANAAFGSKKWFRILTSGGTKEEMEEKLVLLYKNKLRSWFRFVVPLPFVPKKGQIYHVFCCSNFSVGTGVISSIYGQFTRKVGLQADNNQTYRRFKEVHPILLEGLSGRQRPNEWKTLWYVMRNHADGVCDSKCRKLREICGSSSKLKRVLKWLLKERYLKKIRLKSWPWPNSEIQIYQIDWKFAEQNLGVAPPIAPTPLQPS
ncbi:MAG: three-Cys-motif partner protein TcmP [Candidatus Thorarchaeota archaeon]